MHALRDPARKDACHAVIKQTYNEKGILFHPFGGHIVHVNYNFSLNIINIIILIYLMIDAPKHGKNQILWGVLGFFFGTIALTIYFFLTGRKGWAIVWLCISLLSIAAFLGFIFLILHVFLHVI
jgi:ABC-type multidrug transport system permease subunit